MGSNKLQGGADVPGKIHTKTHDTRTETEEATKELSADDEGQETVTTMINYVAPTTWWNTAIVRDADTEIESGTCSVVPQPEDA